jgi:hypothetical protein
MHVLSLHQKALFYLLPFILFHLLNLFQDFFSVLHKKDFIPFCIKQSKVQELCQSIDTKEFYLLSFIPFRFLNPLQDFSVSTKVAKNKLSFHPGS